MAYLEGTQHGIAQCAWLLSESCKSFTLFVAVIIDLQSMKRSNLGTYTGQSGFRFEKFKWHHSNKNN